MDKILGDMRKNLAVEKTLEEEEEEAGLPSGSEVDSDLLRDAIEETGVVEREVEQVMAQILDAYFP